MPNYDFLNLSPAEFEELSRDLLQKHLEVYLESFTQGKDDGIDLRHSKDKENTFIVQCKRYKDYSSLKPKLNEELEKVKKRSESTRLNSSHIPLSRMPSSA